MFTFWQLVLVEELIRVSCVHWCWFDWYGEKQQQLFCKATIEGLSKDWPGGYYIVLRSKTMVTVERRLLDIGYKYNSRKFLSFVATAGSGSTTLDIPYLSKYPDQFSNVSIRPVACLLLMSKFFGSVNKLDTQNKYRQSYLALEKFWVTQCCWLWFCTTVDVGMTITNFWKLFRYGVKRDHHDKFIGIREFSEQIAVDWFNNNFASDKDKPENNIPYLDAIDNEGTVYTCRSFYYSSSSPCNSEIITISDITIATSPTTTIGHTASKEVELEGGRYNRAARGYCYRRLHNGNIFLKRSLWYCHDCSIWFRRKTYYCKKNGRDLFALHHDSLVCLPWNVFCLTCP